MILEPGNSKKTNQHFFTVCLSIKNIENKVLRIHKIVFKIECICYINFGIVIVINIRMKLDSNARLQGCFIGKRDTTELF